MIPANTDGEVIGITTTFHNVVHTVARCCMNFSQQLYKDKKGDYKTITNGIVIVPKLIYMFTYPLSYKYLSKFLKGALADDRKAFKVHFIATFGEQHLNMHDKAFAVRSLW